MGSIFYSNEELRCTCCGENAMQQSSLYRLDSAIVEAGLQNNLPHMNSAYRCEHHNKVMGYTQTHASGHAFDLRCSHKVAFKLMNACLTKGFTGFGVKQKGDHKRRMIHVDDLPEALPRRPRPHVWSY